MAGTYLYPFVKVRMADLVLGTRLPHETKLTMRRTSTRNQAFQIMLLAPEMMRR